MLVLINFPFEFFTCLREYGKDTTTFFCGVRGVSGPFLLLLLLSALLAVVFIAVMIYCFRQKICCRDLLLLIGVVFCSDGMIHNCCFSSRPVLDGVNSVDGMETREGHKDYDVGIGIGFQDCEQSVSKIHPCHQSFLGAVVPVNLFQRGGMNYDVDFESWVLLKTSSRSYVPGPLSFFCMEFLEGRYPHCKTQRIQIDL